MRQGQLRQVVLDAGPVIGFFSEKDTYHQQCTAGFDQLIKARTTLLIPLPIVFEVYKWILQNTYPQAAQKALITMDSYFQVVTLSAQDFHTIKLSLTQMTQWTGSLEDATVVMIAIQYRCPVWTYNFRDFSRFESLDFWNPSL